MEKINKLKKNKTSLQENYRFKTMLDNYNLNEDQIALFPVTLKLTLKIADIMK